MLFFKFSTPKNKKQKTNSKHSNLGSVVFQPLPVYLSSYLCKQESKCNLSFFLSSLLFPSLLLFLFKMYCTVLYCIVLYRIVLYRLYFRIVFVVLGLFLELFVCKSKNSKFKNSKIQKFKIQNSKFKIKK